jgi:hypothetical protein
MTTQDSPLNDSAAAGLAGDEYEITIPSRAPLRCRVPTLAEVGKLTALQFRIERGGEDAEAAQLEMYELLPQALGLDPTTTRLLPRECARILADFFVRSRIPRLALEADPPAPASDAGSAPPGIS